MTRVLLLFLILSIPFLGQDILIAQDAGAGDADAAADGEERDESGGRAEDDGDGEGLPEDGVSTEGENGEGAGKGEEGEEEEEDEDEGGILGFLEKWVSETIENWKKSRTLTLDDTVSTPLRKTRKIRKTSQTVHVIKEGEVNSKGAQFLDEALGSAPGMEVWTKGFWGSVSSLSLRGTYSPHTLVVMDGRPLNGLWNGIADAGWIPLVAAEQIEVVKGPSSHIWGSGAMGGVVQLLTREPTEDMTGRGGGMYMNWDSFEVRGWHSYKMGDFGYFLGGSVRNTTGFRPNTELWSDDTFVKLVYDVDPKALQVRWSGWLHRDRHGVPGPEPAAIFAPAPFGNYEVTSLYDYDRHTLFANTFGLKYTLDEGTAIDATLYHDYRWIKVHARSGSNFFATTSNYDSVHINTILGGTLVARLGKILDGHEISVGLDLRSETYVYRGLESELTGTANPPRFYTEKWHRDSNTAGLFLADTWTFSETTDLTLGFRVDQNSRVGPQWGFHAGGTHQMGEDMVLRASVGRAFRFPAFADQFYNPGIVYHPWSDVTNWQAGREGLGAESLVGGEIGASAQKTIEDVPLLDELKIFAQVAAFYHFLGDQLGQPDTSVLTTATHMYDRHVAGVDLSIRAHPAAFLLVDFNYTWLWAYGMRDELVYNDGLGTIRYNRRWRRSEQLPPSYWRFETILNTGVGVKVTYYARYTGSRVTWVEDPFTAAPEVEMCRASLNHFFKHGIYLSYDFLGVITVFGGYEAYPGQAPAAEIDPYYTSYPDAESEHPVPQDSWTFGVSGGGTF